MEYVKQDIDYDWSYFAKLFAIIQADLSMDCSTSIFRDNQSRQATKTDKKKTDSLVVSSDFDRSQTTQWLAVLHKLNIQSVTSVVLGSSPQSAGFTEGVVLIND